MAKSIQLVHNTSIEAPSEIHAFIHCGKCLDELPAGVAPAEWARTQTGYTDHGFQVWCTRHDVNIDSVTIQAAPGVAVATAKVRAAKAAQS